MYLMVLYLFFVFRTGETSRRSDASPSPQRGIEAASPRRLAGTAAGGAQIRAILPRHVHRSLPGRRGGSLR